MIDHRSSAQRVPRPRRPTNSAPNVTYNSDLTRISASGSDSLSTIMDEDLEDDVDEQETMPLFWSLHPVEDREDYELSVARRATV